MSEVSTSHSGKICSSSPPLICAIAIKIKVGVIDMIVPAYRRRSRRFESGETAVLDLKAMLAKKLPMAITPSQNGRDPRWRQKAANAATLA